MAEVRRIIIARVVDSRRNTVAYKVLRVENYGKLVNRYTEYKSVSSIARELVGGIVYENIELRRAEKGYEVVGNNGALSRYAVEYDCIDKVENINRVVIIDEIEKSGSRVGYRITNGSGKVYTYYTDDVIKMVRRYGLANGELREDRIQPIKGSYKVERITENKKEMVKK